jgi:small subunit ribosomal protein S13
MAIIFNREIKNKKLITENLICYYGLGIYSIKQIKQFLGVSDKIPFFFILFKKKNTLLVTIKNILPLVLDKLNFLNWCNKKRMLFISCYKGFKHAYKLPTRGQRTKTNAKTVKCLP